MKGWFLALGYLGPCKWLSLSGVAEISHSETCNFSADCEFK
jgi:hypothetical protein